MRIAVAKCAVIAGLLLVSTSAWANWMAVKDEADPFDETKRTFLAVTMSKDGILGIRCTDGVESVAVSVPADALNVGDAVHVTLANEGKHTHPEFDGTVLSAEKMAMFDFAENERGAFTYLRDAKTLHLRMVTAKSSNILTFPDTSGINAMLDKADKACGVQD